MIRDVGKLALLAIALVGIMVLRAIGEVGDPGFYTLVGAIVGYLTGNGVLAARRQAPSPAIGHEVASS